MKNADSVKARLMNECKVTGRDFQSELTAYALERTLYRVSVSRYADCFTIKGGILLYAMFDRSYPRMTKDIDLYAKGVSNGQEHMEEVFREIFSLEVDDPITYDLDSIEVREITPQKKYPGVNIQVKAYLDKTRMNVFLDIGFDDTVNPDPVAMDFPVILDDDPPKLKAYSVYTVLAEKFEAMVSRGMLNSRYKDFYDIWKLAGKFGLDGSVLQESLVETFAHRKTSFDDIVVFDGGFLQAPYRITQWNAFVRKKVNMDTVSLEEAVHIIETLMKPVVEAIRHVEEFSGQWDPEQGCWI